jgi:hypothetical protein
MKNDMDHRYASGQERLIECANRAKIAGVAQNVVNALYDGEIMTSQNVDGNCTLRATSLTESIAIQDMQDITNGTVWHVIRTNVGPIGDILIMLYVSDDKNEWAASQADAIERVSDAYVTAMPCGNSDNATVALRLTGGGLYATYLHLDTNKLARTQRKALA